MRDSSDQERDFIHREEVRYGAQYGYHQSEDREDNRGDLYQPTYSPMDLGYYPIEVLPDKNTPLAGICYLGFWLSALLLFLWGRQNRFVCFHALQSLLFFGPMSLLLGILVAILGFDFSSWSLPKSLFFMLIVAIIVLVWLAGMLAAFGGKYMKLPVVGKYAERYVIKHIDMWKR